MKIYVSNLSFNTGDAELNDLFAEFGEVTSAKVITDRETGRSRGFGFVEMGSDEAAAAIQALNNKSIEGRNIAVSIAKDKPEGGGRNFNGGGSGGYGNKKW